VKLTVSTTTYEKKSDIKWKSSCNCDDNDEHIELKPKKEDGDYYFNEKDKLQNQLNQTKRSIIISKLSDDGDSSTLHRSCIHNAFTKSSSISHDLLKKKSSAFKSDFEHSSENQSKFREEYFKCYAKELISNLKSLEEELTNISAIHQLDNPNKLKSSRQNCLYSKLKFETVDWLTDFIVEELPSYSAFTYYYNNNQISQGLVLYVLVYLQNELFFSLKKTDQVLMDMSKQYSSSFK
jgi:hypothetical protein